MAETQREPYPGLIMPRFARPGGDADTTASTTPEIRVAFASGLRASVTPQELVRTPVHARRIVGYNFFRGLDADGQLRDRTAPSHLELLLNGWDDGTAPRRGVERARDLRTVAWLQERLAELFPERTPTQVTFAWTRRTHRIPEGTVLDSRLVRTVEVPL